jgi:glutathione S-transferase
VIKLWHAPRTRSVRVRWLLEELALPHVLETVVFQPEGIYGQATPLNKLPVIEDDGVVICESGAIIEYLLERYGNGRLAPAIGSPERGRFLQWMHFAESTAYSPLSVLIWHGFYRRNADRFPEVMADARERARAALAFAEKSLGDGQYLLGDSFSAADIMLAFTLAAAQSVGVLDERFPRLGAYLGRLQQRPAYVTATS